MATKSFEYEFLFRPHFGGRGRRAEADADGRSALAELRRAARRLKRAGRSTAKSRYDVGETPRLSRRCMVKAHYVPTARDGRLANARHLNYLEREGVETDGSPGRLYDASGPVDASAFAEPLPGERRQFRFVVSPEDAHLIELGRFARELLAQMEADLGQPLIWAAVNHHDTEHPHVHVVVRGVDTDGRELRIPPRYIQNDMRARAQQLLTRELGLRTPADVARQRHREIDQERFTSLDRSIQALATPEGGLSARALSRLPGQLRGAVQARLATLARLGLAERGAHGAWSLAEGWVDDLVRLGLRNDIVKRLHRTAPADPSRYRLVDPSALVVPIEGVVRARGLHDEQTGEMFAVVENVGGELHYVRLDRDAAAFLGDGDIVRISRMTESWVKPTDEVLVRIAERTGGIYDPAAHRRQLEAAPQKIASPEDLVSGNLRRLERLAKYGLVARLSDGTWRIPADLLRQLQQRAATHPRHQVRVQYLGANLGIQSTYPGPTWLDRQPAMSAEHPGDGFGAALGRALRARSRFIVSQGLGEPSADVARRLDAMERLLVGRRLARDLGVAYSDAPGGVRGTLVNGSPLPSGRAFARVMDERASRLVLVPVTPETTRLEGRLVEVTVDQDKRSIVRPARDLNRGNG